MQVLQQHAQAPSIMRCLCGRSAVQEAKRLGYLLFVGAPRLFWGDATPLPDGSGAREACCCSTWKMAVLDGRWSGSADRQSLMRAAISSVHSSGTLQAINWDWVHASKVAAWPSNLTSCVCCQVTI